MIKTISNYCREAVSSTDLVRDDTLDVVGKFVEGEVHLEAEDIITDGTIKS